MKLILSPVVIPISVSAKHKVKVQLTGSTNSAVDKSRV